MPNAGFAQYLREGTEWSFSTKKVNFQEIFWWKKDELIVNKDCFSKNNLTRIAETITDRCGHYISEEEIKKPVDTLFSINPTISSVKIFLLFPRNNYGSFAIELFGN